MQLTENTRQAFPVIYGIASWREPYLELLLLKATPYALQTPSAEEGLPSYAVERIGPESHEASAHQ